MSQTKPAASLASQDQDTQRLLAGLHARFMEGQPPPPQELALAQTQAMARVAALADSLSLTGHGSAPEGLAEADLTAYEAALILCMDLTILGLELTRQYGPAYLLLSGSQP